MVKKEAEMKSYKNESPWLYQLTEIRRPRDKLSKNIEGDIVIIGAGIAGISTAYFILRDTHKKVILIEANKAAHGATGHNAGQVVSYFERPFSNIVKEYGLGMAAHGQEEILGAWSLLEEIYKDAQIQTPFSNFIGYAGCSTYEQLIKHLKNKSLRKKAKVKIEEIFVAKNAPFLSKIPKKFKGLYTIVPHSKVLELLETKDGQFYTALASKKGCLNSALFCEEVLGYLLYKYKDRFSLFEETPIDNINLNKNDAELITKEKNKIKAQKVILCTNGFSHIQIKNKAGKDIDKSFHERVIGVVGYMAGYLDKEIRKSTAISYLSKNKPVSASKEADEEKYEEPYFYLTRRSYSVNKDNSTLVCAGGPEVLLEGNSDYIRDRPYFQKRQDEINAFLKKDYIYAKKAKIHYKFRWHGLMGYTNNGLRVIGPDKTNPVLMYNLGCNGVGILPSIYGGYKIARFVIGIKMRPSIFDPK